MLCLLLDNGMKIMWLGDLLWWVGLRLIWPLFIGEDVGNGGEIVSEKCLLARGWINRDL